MVIPMNTNDKGRSACYNPSIQDAEAGRGQPDLHIEFYTRLEGEKQCKRQKEKEGRRGDRKRKGNKH